MNNQINFKQLLTRSYDTFALSQKIKFKDLDNYYDQFAIAVNLVVDSIELLIKGICYLFNDDFTENHDYSNLRQVLDFIGDKYDIQDIVIKINNNSFYDGKLIHEFKYADKNTELSDKDKKRHNPDFYKDYSEDNYNELVNLYIMLREAAILASIGENIISDKYKFYISKTSHDLGLIEGYYGQALNFNRMFGNEREYDNIEMKMSLQYFIFSCADFINNFISLDEQDVFNYEYFKILNEMLNFNYIDVWCKENEGNIMNKIDKYYDIIFDFRNYIIVKLITL